MGRVDLAGIAQSCVLIVIATDPPWRIMSAGTDKGGHQTTNTYRVRNRESPRCTIEEGQTFDFERVFYEQSPDDIKGTINYGGAIPYLRPQAVSIV